MPLNLSATLRSLSFVLCLAGAGSLFAKTPNADLPKFSINSDKQIVLSAAGNLFVKNVAKRQVNGRLKLVTKTQAYKWMDRFIKLSNRKAQQSADFTPVNNLFNHLELCDEILGELILAPGEIQTALKKEEEIPKKRKEKLLEELNGLKAKLREDTKLLVESGSRENFIVLIDFYDKALKETLDINIGIN